MSHPKSLGSSKAHSEHQNILNYNKREEETLARSLLKRIQKTKKILNWEEDAAIKFGFVVFLLSFSLFRRNFFFLCIEITIKYFLIFLTAFTTWRIFISSRITFKIKLLLSFWRWAFFKFLFLTRAMAENVKILSWQSHKTELLQKFFCITSTWQVPQYPKNYCPENNFLGLFWLPKKVRTVSPPAYLLICPQDIFGSKANNMLIKIPRDEAPEFCNNQRLSSSSN